MSDFDNMFAKFGFAKKDKKQPKDEGQIDFPLVWSLSDVQTVLNVETSGRHVRRVYTNTSSSYIMYIFNLQTKLEGVE